MNDCSSIRSFACGNTTQPTFFFENMAEQRTRRVTFKMRKADFKCMYDKAAKLGIPWSEYIRNLILEDCKK